MKDNLKIKSSIGHILLHCGSLQSNENVVIVCDKKTITIAKEFYNIAKSHTVNVILQEIPLALSHGVEPPMSVVKDMLNADLIVSLAYMSLAHTKARVEAGKKQARFLSLPLYSWDLLSEPALTFDYKKQAPLVKKISELYTQGSMLTVTSSLGTNIQCDISGRKGNYCPGFVVDPGDLGSPPDIEANIAPVEDKSNGVVIIDGSITCPEIGLLDELVEINIINGAVESFKSKNKIYIDILYRLFDKLETKKKILAECGIGLNPLAKLTGDMLTDEGALGCIHFGFGSNSTIGGKNNVHFHLDFVFKSSTLAIDDQIVISQGDIVI